VTRAAPRRPFDWQRWVTIGVIALVALAAVGWWQIRANRHGLKVAAEFTSGLGVYKGSDVRILGVHVGTVDSVTPEGTTVLVTFHLDPGVKVAADTEAIVVSPNLVADRYLQLTGAYGGSGPTLADGTTLHTDRTATPVELDELYRSLTDLATALGPNGANSQGALARLLNTAAANLGGNGQQINTTLTDLSKAAGTLSTSKDALFATLSNLDQFTDMLAQNNSSLIQVNQQLASVSTVLANDRASFAAAMQQLGSALALVQQFIQNNRAMLKTDVGKLSTLASTLAAQRASLLQTLSAAPLLVQNFINAYDPGHNVLLSRTDLNELGVWGTTPASSSSSSSAPNLPAMLPVAGQPTGGGR
jgi:virulence factor Mce-like protein